MSPEQVRGKPADSRSDLFSFGVILYEMLSGRRAFVRGSTVEIMHAILKEDPPELATPDKQNSPVRLIARCAVSRKISCRTLPIRARLWPSLSKAFPEDPVQARTWRPRSHREFSPAGGATGNL
jgi:serine/threonine protein kinase